MELSSLVVPCDTVAFVRSGALRCVIGERQTIVDVNHALAVPRGAPSVSLTAQGTGAVVTLVRDAGIAVASAPQLLVIDSNAYLQYRADVGITVQRGHERCSKYCAGYVFSMQEYLNVWLTRPPVLRDIAAACALSPFTASRLFHGHVGIPLRTYVKRLRLRNALHKIVAGSEIASIALDFGFCDHAHFTNAFRAEFGMAPSEVRASSNTRQDRRAAAQ